MPAETTTARPPPLVSVALATCNGARFLREQLDSIYAQTLTDIEVVASDDASDDQTVSILREYQKSRGLRLLRNPRRLGVSANFEAALRECRGRHIALADQDDRWLPHKLERLLHQAQSSGAALVYSDARLVDEHGHEFGRGLRETLELVYLRGNPHAAFYLHNCVTGCTVLLRRELLHDALPMPPGVLMHDWWLAYVAALTDGIDFVDEPLVEYRQHGANQLGAVAPRRLRGVSDALRLLVDVPGAWRRLERVRWWQARRAQHLAACAALERRLGRDTRLVDALVEWNTALGGSLRLTRYRRLFKSHPELHACLPAAKQTRLLRHRLLSVPLLFTLVHVHTLGLALLTVALLLAAVREWS